MQAILNMEPQLIIIQGGFQMFIQAYDDDGGVTDPDHLDDIFINLELAANSGFTMVTTFSGSRSKVSIRMRFRVDCSTNYYGSNCSQLCEPQQHDTNGHYTCNPVDGSRNCLPDYYGSKCNNFCAASNDVVNGFYTCNPDDGSRICTEGFTNPEDFCRESKHKVYHTVHPPY